MAGKGDMLHRLPELQWRGLTAAVESAPLQNAHEQTPRRVAYIDGTGHDNTGSVGYSCTAKLWFVETVKAGDFSTNLGKWIAAVEDGSSDKLVHPIRGPMRARVVNWTINLHAGNRGGTDMTVAWAQTIDDFDAVKPLQTIDIDPSALAEAGETAAAAFDIEYPDGQKDLTLLEGINGIVGDFTSFGMSISGKMSVAMGGIVSMVTALDALDDHDTYPAHDNLVLLWAQLEERRKRAEAAPARPIATRKLQAATTLDAFAVDVGNTIDEVMGLNVAWLNRPLVPVGTTLQFYSS